MAWTAYWADEAEEERIRSIVKDLAERYGIPFNDNTIWSFAGMVYREFFLNDEDKTRSRTYEEAKKVIDFFDVTPDANGEVTIKHLKGSLKIDRNLLHKLKNKLAAEYAEIIGDIALSGNTDKRKEQLSRLAEQERRDKVHALRQSLNRLIAWLQGMDIFTTGLKTVSNSEGAFIYDLLFEIEESLKRELFRKTNKPKTPPHKLDNASKRKIIASYLSPIKR